MTHPATVFCDTHALPPLPLPSSASEGMRACGEHCVASAGLDGAWRGGAPLRQVASTWLDAGCAHSGARCEFTGSGIGTGIGSTMLQLVFESPRCGIFVAKQTGGSAVEGDVNRTRIEGVLGLMKYLVDAVDAARTWPEGQRLAVVDDDRAGLACWGWVPASGARWDELQPDATAWIAAMLSVEALGAAPRA